MTSEKIRIYYQNLQLQLSQKSSKQFIQTIITEIIWNSSYKLLPEKSFQTILTNFYHRSHSKLCFQTISNDLEIIITKIIINIS